MKPTRLCLSCFSLLTGRLPAAAPALPRLPRGSDWGRRMVWWGWLAALLALLLAGCQVQVLVVHTASMEPALKVDQAYTMLPATAEDVIRGDIVVYRTAHDELNAKRLIAIPGDRVEIRSGELYLNGELFPEDYVLEPMEYSYDPQDMGEDEYFVLGDNRNASSDSHILGPISGEAICGRLIP